jgi:selenocysteine lyase/cysteine desulfurase
MRAALQDRSGSVVPVGAALGPSSRGEGPDPADGASGIPRGRVTLSPEEFRSHFPTCAEAAYLAACSQGPASHETLAAAEAFLRSWREEGGAWSEWVAGVEEARAAFARLIHADVDEVAVVPSASAGAQAVASALDFSGHRRVIAASDLEFPSLAHVWLSQRSRGAEVRLTRVPSAGPDTALVSAYAVSYADGSRCDLAAAARQAHAAGALLFVDAYQGAGVVPLDVRAVDCDFLVAGALKYLLGTAGIAFLYVRRELCARLVPAGGGWFAQRDPFAFDPFTLDLAPDARRFQSGTPAVLAGWVARAGLGLLARTDPQAVAAHVATLADELDERLRRAGARVVSPAGGPLVCVEVPDPEESARRLRRQGVIVAPRGRVIRLALHYYNNREDVARAAEAVAGAV